MKNEKDLNEKIEQLREEYVFEQEAARLLPEGTDFMAIIHRRKNKNEYAIKIKASSLKEAAELLKIFEPSEVSCVVGSSGKDRLLSIPWRIDVINPCKPSELFPFCLQVYYQSKQYSITIQVLANTLTGYLIAGERNIYDTEHHYFTGQSYDKLRNMKVRCYGFGAFEKISWYGGDITLLDTHRALEIIEVLKKGVNEKELERIEAEKKRVQKLQQEQFEKYNDTDGMGNSFSDADPGL